MTSWYQQARSTIHEVHVSLPEGVTLTERMKAVDDAYPFGIRKYHPYKMWLKARREYLCRYGYQPKGKPIAESPLFESPMERMMRRAMAAQK